MFMADIKLVSLFSKIPGDRSNKPNVNDMSIESWQKIVGLLKM